METKEIVRAKVCIVPKRPYNTNEEILKEVRKYEFSSDPSKESISLNFDMIADVHNIVWMNYKPYNGIPNITPETEKYVNVVITSNGKPWNYDNPIEGHEEFNGWKLAIPSVIPYEWLKGHVEGDVITMSLPIYNWEDDIKMTTQISVALELRQSESRYSRLGKFQNALEAVMKY